MQQESNWDPLESKLSDELVSATIKRQIKNILKSYTGWFDPFSELIQNSLDALEKRKEREDENYQSKLWINIDLSENLISVTDNGIGFREEQFRNFLAPSVSFKTQRNRGNKGVGATYLGYGFNHLQIGTRTPDFDYLGTLKGGREWVEDEASVETRPKIIGNEKPTHTPFEEVESGSTFTVRLTGKFIRPKDLSWIGATTARQWASILRIKTPLGGIYPNGSQRTPNFACEIKVIGPEGNTTVKEINSGEYLYPHTVISACTELDNIRQKQAELLKKGKDASQLPARFYKLNGLYNFWDYTDFIEEDSEFEGRLTARQEELALEYEVSCYGFFCYSTDVWDHYNDKVLEIRKGERILRGGLQLGTNSMPQGELILIPLTRNIGYQNTSHVVVHFEQADPDLGRKGFQPELEELGKNISRILVNAFLSWRKHLKKETGAPPDITAKKDIHDWISEQEDHEKNNPLVIKREDIFLPTMEPSITSKPRNEQDVVSLFNQLLAGGVVRGVRLMAASSHKQYDGVFKFIMTEPLGNHIFDLDSNPLGVESSDAHEFTSNPRILEYKYSVDALIEEFEKEVKSEGDIDLVVAWEMGSEWKSRYEVTPLLHLDNIHHRYFHGGTHLATAALTGDTVFPVIILSELIDFINDPEGVQEYHHARYMSD